MKAEFLVNHGCIGSINSVQFKSNRTPRCSREVSAAGLSRFKQSSVLYVGKILVRPFQFNFMFLGQITFVLGPRWQAIKMNVIWFPNVSFQFIARWAMQKGKTMYKSTIQNMKKSRFFGPLCNIWRPLTIRRLCLTFVYKTQRQNNHTRSLKLFYFIIVDKGFFAQTSVITHWYQ